MERVEEFILTSEIVKDIEYRENLGKLLKPRTLRY